MRSYKTILKYFCKKMMQEYCPKLDHTRLPTKHECLAHLIPAIANRWKLQVAELNCQGTFFDALRGKKFYPDMLERLAVFYYLTQEGENKEELLKYYRETAKQQRRKAMPYWNRFVEEYKQQPKPEKKPSLAPRTVARWLMAATPEQLKELDREMKKIAKERKKKKMK